VWGLLGCGGGEDRKGVRRVWMIDVREEGRRRGSMSSMTGNVPMAPNPKGIRPMIGMIQWVCLSADHPYQKKLIGMKNAKKRQVARRISGW
jgi:hypothetical protein